MSIGLHNVTAGYSSPIIKNISFSAESGELTGLIGRNGSGKTTLLRAVSGDVRNVSGSISVEGTDLNTLSVRERAELVSYLPQQIQLQPGIRGIDLAKMGYFAKHGIFYTPNEEEKKRIESIADTFGIGGLLSRDLTEMSTGQRQMVSLLRVAVQDTPALLLDEPSGALDIENSERLFSMLRDFSKNGKKSILVVVHDISQALFYCDKLILMDGGEIKNMIRPRECTADAIQKSLSAVYPDIRVKRDTESGRYLCY